MTAIVSHTRSVNAQPPTVERVWVEPEPAHVGQMVSLKIVVGAAACPVDWLDVALYYDETTPPTNIFGGGHQTSLAVNSASELVVTQSHTFSDFSPIGRYAFRNIAVMNTARLSAPVEDVEFELLPHNPEQGGGDDGCRTTSCSTEKNDQEMGGLRSGCCCSSGGQCASMHCDYDDWKCGQPATVERSEDDDDGGSVLPTVSTILGGFGALFGLALVGREVG